MDYHTAKINLHIDLLNLANRTVCAVQPVIAGIFAKLVGSKVIKADEQFTKAVKALLTDAIKPFELIDRLTSDGGQNVMVWVSNSAGGLFLRVKACITRDDHTEYLESDWCKIGDTDRSGALVELSAFDPADYKHDWDLTDVLCKIEEVKRRRRAVAEAEGMIPDFLSFCR